MPYFADPFLVMIPWLSLSGDLCRTEFWMSLMLQTNHPNLKSEKLSPREQLIAGPHPFGCFGTTRRKSARAHQTRLSLLELPMETSLPSLNAAMSCCVGGSAWQCALLLFDMMASRIFWGCSCQVFSRMNFARFCISISCTWSTLIWASESLIYIYTHRHLVDCRLIKMSPWWSRKCQPECTTQHSI